ncbi:MAG TPA: hypothetical protein DCQ26_06300 [Marinilabiliales bacterium]|nr:MAG: hypothetical protein A2W95_04050 [Bacteroidetes bacterium GWA2_40_14]OFX58504.1 MAG: hypothetical protein A2W84_08715 [Bacteroidetes bacterium GWC2_40_13]OFX74126.1 MAG: hypothetical protein A2W96_12525 [Bacteroidetes bacterium GWD2_40_43]OFX93040.1 MAG: hypothetical protein A2W97_05550 [Bacteroidetes bacterium GWE2_40_63]OFY21410.1 MAG: hypothetical protein A2W88_09550 [Bacteroidetes bacterium GWF2_40_13]OFZ27404.1 MAG: hypothetical protein A2437_14025 [Bacteroidetes bacterium RIFOXYC
METLSDKKFKTLSMDEMNKIEGGLWGWHVNSVFQLKDGSTTTHWHHYNIWGNYDGGYANTND